MKMKLWTSQPKKQRWRKITLTIALIVFIGTGLSFGTIKIIGATQTGDFACPEQTEPDCLKRGQQPPCPKTIFTCPLDTAGQRGNLNSIGGTP